MSLSIRPIEDRDYDTFTALRNAVFPDHTSTVDEVRYWDANRDPRGAWGRLVGETDGLMVGAAYYGTMQWMFHPQKFWVAVLVHPEYQGRGYGRQLYSRLMDVMEPYHPVQLRTEAREDMTRAVDFATRCGFVEDQRAWESRLDLRSFDATPFNGVFRKVASHGIQIKTMADLAADPDALCKLHVLVTELDQDVPTPEPITEVPFEQWQKQLIDNPNYVPEALLVALDGDDYVGMSQLIRRVDENYVENMLTGTRRSHRRKGIALAMKLQNIAWAQQHGYDHIRTGNDTTNRPMLNINEALGFEKQPVWIVMVKKFSNE